MERIWGVAGGAIVGGGGSGMGFRVWMYQREIVVFRMWWFADVVMLEKFTTRKCCGEKMRKSFDQP